MNVTCGDCGGPWHGDDTECPPKAPPEHRVSAELAPLPWRALGANKQYLRIVDAKGDTVCNFYPYAKKGGRGWDAMMALAEQIVEAMNSPPSGK